MKHLYIHIPFCASRCGYCDFYSEAGGLEMAPAYVEALLAELSDSMLKDNELRTGLAGSPETGMVSEDSSLSLETVYIGGGTPTVLGAGLLERLLSGLRPYCRSGAEITVEANPSTLSLEMVSTLADSGVTRVSLGAQSFSQRLRRNLGRAGSVEAIASAFGALRSSGIKNIGIDLMFSIPEQTLEDLQRDLTLVLELGPEHISCYELTVKAGSEFQQRWKKQLETVAENGPEYYRYVVEVLEADGYRWYETSNFARPGRECRHNLAYWKREDYLGIGAGAWSSVGQDRWHNIGDIGKYSEATREGDWKALRESQRLSAGQGQTEMLIMGLRLENGIDRSPVSEAIDIEQEKLLLRNGFLVNEGGRISLTRRGRFVANEVCARLLRD